MDEIVNGTVQNIRETGHWCFAEVNEIDKCLASQTKEKGWHKLLISGMKRKTTWQTLQHQMEKKGARERWPTHRFDTSHETVP